jgi:hypothetical protein
MQCSMTCVQCREPASVVFTWPMSAVRPDVFGPAPQEAADAA